MIPDFSGDFVNFDSTHDGDLCEILDEGKVEYNENLKKDMFNLKVSVNGGKVKIFSPSNKAGQELQKAFGLDTKDWKNQKFEILHVQGKMAIRPIKVTKV